MRMTNRDLKAMFRFFNHKYFRHSLENDTPVKFANIRVLGRTKNIWHQRPASAKERRENKLNKTAIACYYRPSIFIANSIRFANRLIATTLIHEMVHAENMKYGCGPNWNKFNRRMLELAKSGAFNGWW